MIYLYFGLVYVSVECSYLLHIMHDINVNITTNLTVLFKVYSDKLKPAFWSDSDKLSGATFDTELHLFEINEVNNEEVKSFGRNVLRVINIFIWIVSDLLTEL